MLTCNNLSLSYNEKEIFKNFSVSLYPNSIVILRGKNGSGKTSLLKILSSLLKPSEGGILWQNQNILNDIYSYRNLINYIGHNISLKEELSVFENIEFWSNLANTQKLILAAIHYFKLENLVDINYKLLSAGNKQKVELTRLITKITPIWLLDEPENNLDSEGRNLLYNLISSRAEQGGIIVYATHNDINIPKYVEINLDDYKSKC